MDLTHNATTTKYIVLTHQPCRDGFVASICARKYYQTTFGNLTPIFWGVEPSKQVADLNALMTKIKMDDPENKIKTIYIEAFDIAFNPEVILNMVKTNPYHYDINIYDHHKSSLDSWQTDNLYNLKSMLCMQYCVSQLVRSLVPAYNTALIGQVNANTNNNNTNTNTNTYTFSIYFGNDMNECGASLAYKYYFDNKPIPTFIQYVKDRDNWLFDTPEAKARHSMEVNEYLMATCPKYDDYPAWFEYFNKDQAFFDAAYTNGKLITDMKNTYINSIISCGACRQINGNTVFVCNSPILVSDVGNAACEKMSVDAVVSSVASAEAVSAYLCDYAMIWRYDEKSKKYCVSLRSRKGGKDVQEIAKKYGGGGHINAAGFESTNMQFLELPNGS